MLWPDMNAFVLHVEHSAGVELLMPSLRNGMLQGSKHKMVEDRQSRYTGKKNNLKTLAAADETSFSLH